MANTFERKFGRTFLDSVPLKPGVYQIFDSENRVIYVGKSKNLKRRLGNYRNAKRRKKHRKMRKIIESASSLKFEVCESELAAELRENQLIQEHRPRWNVAGAFSFLYPMIGMQSMGDYTSFCYSTEPSRWPEYQFFGAFRSREITREGFYAMMKLLNFIGHRASARRVGYSSFYSFRQIPQEWLPLMSEFFEGSSQAFLEILSLGLLENAGARKSRVAVQEELKKILRFWKTEAVPLRRVRHQVDPQCVGPVSQGDRDVLFLKFKHQSRYL